MGAGQSSSSAPASLNEQTPKQKKMAEYLIPFFEKTKNEIETYLQNPTVPHLFRAQQEIVKLNVLLETFTKDSPRNLLNEPTKQRLKNIVRTTRKLNNRNRNTLRNFKFTENGERSLAFRPGLEKYQKRRTRRACD